MRNIVISAFILFVVGILSSHAQDSAVHNDRLTVYGTGTIDAPADRAKLNFSVKGFGSTLQEAVNTARKKVSTLTDSLLDQGLKESNFFTSRFFSGDNFEGKAFLSSRRDFRAQIDVSVTIDSLEALESIVSTLTKGNLEQLSDISFSLKSDSAMKLEARRLAVENARAKAIVMARELGVALGDVLSVDELLSSSDSDLYMTGVPEVLALRAGPSRYSGGSFYAQRYSVKAGVRIIFEIRGSVNGK